VTIFCEIREQTDSIRKNSLANRATVEILGRSSFAYTKYICPIMCAARFTLTTTLMVLRGSVCGCRSEFVSQNVNTLKVTRTLRRNCCNRIT